MVLVFAAHLGILQFSGQPLFQNLIVEAYLSNLLLAIFIFYILYRYRFRFRNALGFLFMGGSFLKFLVFFIVFYPSYKSDGEMQRLEFAAFFIPYLVALIFETAQASKMLNTLQNPKE
mgnify:CR=1 FL=1